MSVEESKKVTLFWSMPLKLPETELLASPELPRIPSKVERGEKGIACSSFPLPWGVPNLMT